MIKKTKKYKINVCICWGENLKSLSRLIKHKFLRIIQTNLLLLNNVGQRKQYYLHKGESGRRIESDRKRKRDTER